MNDNYCGSRYYPIKRGEFDNLFESFAELFCLFKESGPYEELLETINFPRDIVSYELIKNMVNLICEGACSEYFNYVLEFECLKNINSTHINKLAEIVLVKHVIIQLRSLDITSFFSLANTLCSRNKSFDILNKLNTCFDNIKGFN